MPSAASAKPEKAPSAEASGVPPPVAGAADNSPIRQILVIIEHKIRNLEKRKSKLTSYRDLQKSGKELNADQKVAVAKYDEVAQTLEFARDMCKQVASVALTAEREAKKQAKKDAWVRTTAETSKIRDVLLVLDVLVQMGSAPAREDFLRGSSGAAKLTEQDLKILDDLYPEVTPRHEPNEEGAPAFPAQAMRAAEHLCSIIDGKPKEILGTTYTHIKEIVTAVHNCGYFDKSEEEPAPVQEEEIPAETVEEEVPQPLEVQPPPPLVYPPPPHTLPSPAPLAPAPAVVPAPAYPLRPLPPITLQEVEHAYFAQQYAQQRPITEVIGSQNFFFLQESEIDSPSSTPQPPTQTSPPGPIHTQTFTNQNFIQLGGARVAPEPGVLPPQPHFPAPADIAAFPTAQLPPRPLPHHALERLIPQPIPHPVVHDSPPPRDDPAPPPPAPALAEVPEPIANDDEWGESPEREESGDKPRPQGDGDAQNNRNRRYGRGPRRGQSNGFRGRGGNRQSGDGYQGRQNEYQEGQSDGYRGRQSDGYQGRQSDGYQGRQSDGYQGRQSDGYQGRQSDGYQGRQSDGYQGRQSDGYQGRQNNEGRQSDGYQGRPNDKYSRENSDGNGGRQNDGYRGRDGYQGRQNNGGYQGRQRDDYHGRNDSRSRNGDSPNHHNDNGGSRDKYENSQGGFQGGFKSRGRGGGPRGGFRSGLPRSARPPPQFVSKQNSNAE